MADQVIQIGSAFENFSANFTATEDPLSQGGIWLPNTTLLLTRFQTAGGRAVGKALGVGSFDDSAALLEGFGPDVQITCTMFKGTGLAATTHEGEILFRATQTTNYVEQYELLFAFDGSTQCVRWFNDGGAQGFDFLTPDSGTISLGRELITGDRIRGTIQGSTITMQIIEADDTVHTLGVFTNSAYTTGNHGIGAFTRVAEGGDLTKFCFEDFHITEI